MRPHRHSHDLVEDGAVQDLGDKADADARYAVVPDGPTGEGGPLPLRARPLRRPLHATSHGLGIQIGLILRVLSLLPNA
ncbi:MAG: hypothetical protein ACRESZ_13275, partial [Methylococcales bacterium]